MVRTIIASLVDNALKHGASTVRLRVSLSEPFTPDVVAVQPPQGAMFLVIEDDGPGIDHDFLPRAFDKFEKRSSHSGTGLGLYLVRMMVKALGAGLTVSTGAGGTRVAIAIPTLHAPVHQTVSA